MTYDTLEYNGVEKDFAGWGFALDSIQSIYQAGGADSFTATIVNSTIASEADTPTFDFEESVIVRSGRSGPGGAGAYTGGTIRFVGKRVEQPMRSLSSGQGVTYRFRGPLYDLANTDYQQDFKGEDGSVPVPEVVLFTSTAVASGWVQISVGDQIQAILQWLLDQYALQGMDPPFQYKGRSLNAGAIDLNTSGSAGAGSGGNYDIEGKLYDYAMQSGMSIEPALFGLFLPTFIEKPMKCDQALAKCMELSPRVNMWFDYSTTSGGSPLPTIRFDLVDNMASVTLPLFTGAMQDGTFSHKDISITPREDLRVRAVIVNYRITATVDGSPVVSYDVDKWSGNGVEYGLPGAGGVNLDGAGNNVTDPNCGRRVLTELIDIRGMNVTNVTGTLDLELLACRSGTDGTDAAHDARRAWWASARGGECTKLADTRVRFQDKEFARTYIPKAKLYYAGDGFDNTGAAVSAGDEFTTSDYAFYTHRMFGTYHAWMKQGATEIKTVKCYAVAKMTFAEYDSESAAGTASGRDVDASGNMLAERLESEQQVHLELTNATPDTGTSGQATFSAVGSAADSETYIVGSGGIAEYLYQHLNALQWEGDYIAVATGFQDSGSAQYVTLGTSLNLSGGATAWETMAAQVQEIREDWGSHQTSVKIGVSQQLSASGLSSLLNMWRSRRTWYNPALRSDNTAGGSGEVAMAKATGIGNSRDGVQQKGRAQFFDWGTAPSGTTPGTISGVINADPKEVTAILAATTPTPASGETSATIKEVKPKEVAFCDDAGNLYYAAVMKSGSFTKP